MILFIKKIVFFALLLGALTPSVLGALRLPKSPLASFQKEDEALPGGGSMRRSTRLVRGTSTSTHAEKDMSEKGVVDVSLLSVIAHLDTWIAVATHSYHP